MRTIIQTCIAIWISSFCLTGCHSYGNVVPQTGPTMEQVYDGMGTANTHRSIAAVNTGSNNETVTPNITVTKKANDAPPTNSFKKIPNPELTMYVFPHLAGQAEVPIPGYSTAFNAYDRDHYVLPQDTVRQ